MNGSPPRISIVTPCLNRREFVAEAVESVLAQEYPDVEHIVMDGGSTDGTLDVLAKYPQLKVVSEPDAGLYDAINKGIVRATGEWVGLLNTDDRYSPGAFEAVRDAAAADPQAEVISGEAEVFETDSAGGERLFLAHTGPGRTSMAPSDLAFGVPIINARFFCRGLLARTGPFSMDWRVAADREWLLRMALYHAPRNRAVNRVIYRYRRHAGSMSISSASMLDAGVYREHLEIAARLAGDPALSAAQRQTLRRWHAREAGQGVVEAARSGRVGEAAAYARAGWGADLLWPGRFAGMLACRLAGAVAKRVGRG